MRKHISASQLICNRTAPQGNWKILTILGAMVLCDVQTGADSVVGVGRLTKVCGTDEAEMASLVTDPFQRRGIETELLRRVLAIERSEKLGEDLRRYAC